MIAHDLLAQISGDGRRIVVAFTTSLFQAYLDEGGTHNNAPIMAVAGYFGEQKHWTKFLGNWPHAEFHAQEHKYNHLKPKLVDAINAAELCGTEVCIVPKAFNALAGAGIKAHLGNPYAVGVFVCAIAICERCKDIAPDPRISFVLEDGPPNIDWVRRMLIMMMSSYPIASVTVVKKKDFPQLHPADYLANARATDDKESLDCLFAQKRVNEVPMYPDIFASVAPKIDQFMKQYRRERRKRRYKESREKHL